MPLQEEFGIQLLCIRIYYRVPMQLGCMCVLQLSAAVIGVHQQTKARARSTRFRMLNQSLGA
jgi:hypothetical protein